MEKLRIAFYIIWLSYVKIESKSFKVSGDINDKKIGQFHKLLKAAMMMSTKTEAK